MLILLWLEIDPRGSDFVIATASIAKLEMLKNAGAEVIALDVTASLEELKDFAAKAHSIYGRIGVLVKKAGYAMQGSLEELRCVLVPRGVLISS